MSQLLFIIAIDSGGMPDGSGRSTSTLCFSSTSTQSRQFSRAAYISGVKPPRSSCLARLSAVATRW